MAKRKTSKAERLKKAPVVKNQPFIQKHLAVIFLLMILILVSYVRLRLLNIPLERDEGEYAYFGQLILKGIPPYEAAYNMKFPGVYFLNALFLLVFGQGAAGVHFGLLVVNLASIVFLYLILRDTIGDVAALAGAAAFGVLSLNDAVLGFAGHATHFVAIGAMAGTWILLKAFLSKKAWLYFLAGVLLGLAPIFKQSGIFFSLFGGLLFFVYVFSNEQKQWKHSFKNFGLFLAGGFFPAIIVFLTLWISGVLQNFFFWTMEYPFSYGGQVSMEKGLNYFNSGIARITDGNILLWAIAALGLGFVFFSKPKMKKAFIISFVLLFLVFSFLTIVPGLYFRPHYFITLLPAISILVGISIDSLSKFKVNHKQSMLFKLLSFSILIIALVAGTHNKSEYLFNEEPKDISRRIYGLNPFVESQAIGEFIERNTDDDDKIAIIGSEPQIYFYADRISATGFIYMYPLMEDHDYNLQMQEQMIEEVTDADPEVVVIVDINKSWLRKPHSPTKIFTWMAQFNNSEAYEMIGSVEIYSDTTLYKFTEVAMQNQPVSKYRVRIYKKKNDT